MRRRDDEISVGEERRNGEISVGEERSGVVGEGGRVEKKGVERVTICYIISSYIILQHFRCNCTIT